MHATREAAIQPARGWRDAAGEWCAPSRTEAQRLEECPQGSVGAGACLDPGHNVVQYKSEPACLDCEVQIATSVDQTCSS